MFPPWHKTIHIIWFQISCTCTKHVLWTSSQGLYKLCMWSMYIQIPCPLRITLTHGWELTRSVVYSWSQRSFMRPSIWLLEVLLNLPYHHQATRMSLIHNYKHNLVDTFYSKSAFKFVAYSKKSTLLMIISATYMIGKQSSKLDALVVSNSLITNVTLLVSTINSLKCKNDF